MYVLAVLNFHIMFLYVSRHCYQNFKSLTHSQHMLCLVKCVLSDVCGRPLFTNPVTYNIITFTEIDVESKLFKFHLQIENIIAVSNMMIIMVYEITA